MTDPTPFIQEFLYRGQPDGAGSPPAWHIVLGLVATDPFTQATLITTSETMNVAVATQKGFDLATVLAEINREALASNDTLTGQIATLTAELAVANQQITDLTRQLSTATQADSDAESKVSALEAEVTELRGTPETPAD